MYDELLPVIADVIGDADAERAFEEPETLQRLSAALDDWVTSLAPTELAARLVAATWRAAIEAHHDLIADREMVWMNIATTMAVAELCCEGAPAPEDLLDVFCDADRPVLPSVTARELFEDRWPAFCAELKAEVSAAPLWGLVAFGGLMAHGWWGTAGYADRVDAFLEQASEEKWGDLGQLHTCLLYAPLSITPEQWEDIVVPGIGWRGE